MLLAFLNSENGLFNRFGSERGKTDLQVTKTIFAWMGTALASCAELRHLVLSSPGTNHLRPFSGIRNIYFPLVILLKYISNQEYEYMINWTVDLLADLIWIFYRKRSITLMPLT